MSKDPSTLGSSNYERAALDHYPTPVKVTKALLSVIEDDLEAMQFWEPFVGNGAMYNVIAPLCRNAAGTDIVAYEGFDPHGLFDFFNLYAEDDYEAAVAQWEKGDRKKKIAPSDPANKPVSMADVTALLGFRPDCIISNPPYGQEAVRSVRKALELMKPVNGFVCMLMRHEWDTAITRRDLFDHPAFAAKVVIRFRPKWIEKKEGEDESSPRFSYAFYIWDFTKAATTPHAKANIFYVQ